MGLGLKIFILCLILAPVAILIHEFGHIIAHIIFGYPFVLHYASVSGLEGSCENSIGGFNCIIIDTAGSLMTIIMGLIMAFLFKRTKNVFFFVFGSMFAGRAFMSLFLGVSDENIISLLLGLRPYTIYEITLIASIINAITLLMELERDRIKILSMTIIGGITGIFLWLNIIGPLILP
jgi:hypothetical protein